MSAAVPAGPIELNRYVETMDLPQVRPSDLLRTRGVPTYCWVGFPLSRHVVSWNDLRTLGPVAYCRFEPMWPRRPSREHPGNGVTYLGNSFDTAVLESFHTAGVVDISEDPTMYVARVPLAGLRILDLRSGWASRTRLYQRIPHLHPRTSNRLAVRIHQEFPDLAGMAYPSARNGNGHCLVLWEPARRALEAASLVPEECELLWSHRWRARLARVTENHGLAIMNGTDPVAV